jgi:hypothetical protein
MLQVFAAPVVDPPVSLPLAVTRSEAAPDQVTARGLPSSAANLTPPPGAVARERQAAPMPWRPDDPIGILLTGRVRWSDGGAVESPSVYAVQGKKRASGQSGKDGSYALVGLAPGEWSFRLNIDGGVAVEEAVVLTAEAMQAHDFVVDRTFPIKVMIVTPTGEDGSMAVRKATGFGFADFSVAGQKDPLPERLAPTDYGVVFVGDASWRGDRNPKDGFAGTLHLAGAPPAHVALLQRHLVIAQQVVAPGQTEVRFVVDPTAIVALGASATVRVVDADTGVPIEGARVSLHPSNRMGGGEATDADGRAVLEGLSPGLLRCQITAKEHEEMYTTVQLDAGQRLDLGDVRLGPVVKFAGKVVDADGDPVGGVSISWAELKWLGEVRPFATNRSARSAADGTFSLWGTGRGQIAVAAQAPQGQARLVFDNPPAEPAVLRLAAPSNCTVSWPRDPTKTFTVLLFDAERRPLAAFVLDHRHAKRELAMPPGEYTFEVRDERRQRIKSGTLSFGAQDCTLTIP